MAGQELNQLLNPQLQSTQSATQRSWLVCLFVTDGTKSVRVAKGPQGIHYFSHPSSSKALFQMSKL